MRDSVPSASYSSVCNVLRQWNIPLIPTYRVYRLYDIMHTILLKRNNKTGTNIICFKSEATVHLFNFNIATLSVHRGCV